MEHGDLIERIEAATAPDRELDCLIVRAFYPEASIAPYCVGDDELTVFHAEPMVRNKATLPAYTASLDAAMSLVPEGWTVANLCQQDNRKWWAELRHGFLTSYDKTAFGKQMNPASPALALCAAALRAGASPAIRLGALVREQE